MFDRNKAIWITWEHQRRSAELSRAIGVRFCKLTHQGNRFLRPIFLSFKTIQIIFSHQPQKVFVQNPSNVLAALVCLLSKFLGFQVIVDRHSNFIFSKSDALNYSKWSIFVSNLLSNYSIKNADMTIVTNKYLKHLIEKKGGRAFILQDKLPDFFNLKIVPLKGKYNVIFVCTFSPDEAVDEVIKAANNLPNAICIYITGPYHKYNKLSRTTIPSNVILTGFLGDEDYQSLLQSGTLLLTLTDRDHTLLCSAYESVSVGKPFIMSKKNDLMEYFYKGNVTTANSAKDIAKAINIALERYDILIKEIEELKLELQNAWVKRFTEFKNILENM